MPLHSSKRSVWARAYSSDVIAVPTDVMRKEALDTLAAKTIERFGRVDIVCSNAGVNEYMSPAWEKTPADWQWVMGVNLYGLVHAVNAFIPDPVATGPGAFRLHGIQYFVAFDFGCCRVCREQESRTRILRGVAIRLVARGVAGEGFRRLSEQDRLRDAQQCAQSSSLARRQGADRRGAED